MKFLFSANIFFIALLLLLGITYTKVFTKQQSITDFQCETFQNVTDQSKIVESTTALSSKELEKVFFLFFSNRKDNFVLLKTLAKETSILFKDIMELKFYCQDSVNSNSNPVTMNSTTQNKFDINQVYVIKNGIVIDHKNIKYFSQAYVTYLLTKFNLRQHIEKQIQTTKAKDQKKSEMMTNFLQKYLKKQDKDSAFIEFSSDVILLDENTSLLPKQNLKPYNLNLVQVKLDQNTLHSIDSMSYFILAEQTDNRLSRFLWALLLVFLFSVLCFFFVKFSVDWATSSKSELNRQRDNRLRELTEQINNQYAYVKTEN